MSQPSVQPPPGEHAFPAHTPAHSMTMRLSYADCDPAGILYFATWFPWMERVQTEWLYLNGLGQDTLDERFGFRTITRSTECEYLSPAGLHQEIKIDLTITKLGSSSFRGSFRMTRLADQVQVARGSLSVVCIGSSGTPIRVPSPLRELLQGELLQAQMAPS